MSPEVAIATRLLADAPVVALVSTRVRMLKLRQTETYPAIRIQLIAEPKMKHLRGPIGTTAARIQVDCYDTETNTADPYTSVEAVASAVETALGEEPFTVGGAVRVQCVERLNRMVLYEGDEQRLVRLLLDLRVWSKPVN